jgi:hypothetical protein
MPLTWCGGGGWGRNEFVYNASDEQTAFALGSTQPPIQWVPGTLSLGVKRQRHEADHSLPTSGEVKKMWIYTSTSPCPSMV